LGTKLEERRRRLSKAKEDAFNIDREKEEAIKKDSVNQETKETKTESEQ
jgi:hypothetical protein